MGSYIVNCELSVSKIRYQETKELANKKINRKLVGAQLI